VIQLFRQFSAVAIWVATVIIFVTTNKLISYWERGRNSLIVRLELLLVLTRVIILF